MEPREIDEINFFFILGRPRSGTTLLSTVLNAHPNIAMSMETKLVTELYFKFRRVKHWDEKQLLRFYEFVFTLPIIKFVEFDNDKLKSDILSIKENANLVRLIKIVYLNFLSYFPKDKIIYIGDKTPNFSIQEHYLHIFKKLFPNTKVIHLVRDYRDHYLSVQKVDFKFKQRSMVAYRWRYSNDIITRVFGSNKQNYFLIKHEDLVSSPETNIESICEFIGVKYDSKLLEFYKMKDYAAARIPKEAFMKFHSRLFQPITDKYIYAWKKDKNASYIKLMDSIVGEQAEQYGYEREYKTKPNKLLMFYLRYTVKTIIILTEINDSFSYSVRRFFKLPITIVSYLFIKILKV